jgi:hypothetical protein
MMAINMLASYLKAVAHQRLLIEPWLEDKQFVARGGTVLYAVDADIVKLYTNPKQKSVSSQGRKEGYAQIFPGDEEERSVAIGRALADYIFNSLRTDDCPLLVIPPIEVEIRNIYNAVAEDAKREQVVAHEELASLSSNLQRLKKETNKKTLYDELRNAAPILLKILSDSGHSAEFKRFNHLLTHTRIAPPEYLLKNNIINNEQICHALAPIENVIGWFKFNELYKKWLVDLKRTKSDHRAEERVNRDARAMARLEWINNNLDDNYRLVYITGDTSLHKTASEYYQQNKTQSFSRLYLRHPRAYLAERNVIYPNRSQHEECETTSSEFVQLLDTFLAKFQLGGMNSLKALDELSRCSEVKLVAMVKPVLESFPDTVETFQAKWAAYTQNLILTYSSLETPEERINKTIASLRRDMDELTQRVEVLLNEKLHESWNDFFGAVTSTGYGLLFYKKPSDFCSRSAPLLLFNSLKKSQEFVKKVLDSHQQGTLDSQEYKNAIDELRNEDLSGYSFYLAYALLFAAEGAWNASAIVAARAIEIAKKKKHKNISGREANYLLAIASRHCVREVDDLAKSLVLLDEAERCLAVDRSLRSEELLGGEVRFDAERLAINLSYNMFNKFLNAQIPEHILNLEQLQAKVELLLDQLENKEKDIWVVSNVERTLLSILFMTLFLRWKNGEMPLGGTSMRHYFERLRNNKKSDSKPKISIPFQVQAICLAAGWWTSDNDSEKIEYRRKLSVHLNETNIKTKSVFPYDEKRFKFLRDMVMS